MMMPHITQKYKDNLDAARNANHSLAVFIKVRIHTLLLRRTVSFNSNFRVCRNNNKGVSLFRPVALFQPDGQRLWVQADQQLHQLLYAWRPEGTLMMQTETALIKTV